MRILIFARTCLWHQDRPGSVCSLAVSQLPSIDALRRRWWGAADGASELHVDARSGRWVDLQMGFHGCDGRREARIKG